MEDFGSGLGKPGKVFSIGFDGEAYVYWINEDTLIETDDGEFEFRKGVLFMKEDWGWVASLVKEPETEEVVHKIDEKYIPTGGGTSDLIVKFSSHGSSISCDKTFEEIKNAMPNVRFVFDNGSSVIGITNWACYLDESEAKITCDIVSMNPKDGAPTELGQIFVQRFSMDSDDNITYTIFVKTFD